MSQPRSTTRMMAAIASAWTSVTRALLGLISLDVLPYRPERYFMRGPGPAWRAKHLHDRSVL